MSKEQRWWDEPARIQNSRKAKDSLETFKALTFVLLVGTVGIVFLVYSVILVILPITEFVYGIFQSGPPTGPEGVCDYRTMIGDC